MSYEKLVQTIKGSFYESLIIAALLTILFIALEPVVSRSAASDTSQVVVTQQITGAISITPATDAVTMVGAIDGLTGGTSYGTTSLEVLTNNGAGYNLTIQFSSTTAMIQDPADGTDVIANFQHSTSTATYPTSFLANGSVSQFGFTVNASDTTAISEVFTTNGAGLCGTDYDTDTFTINECWRGASSTDETGTTELMNTTTPTPASGSTSTVQFRVTVPSGANPTVSNGDYIATATLTATDN